MSAEKEPVAWAVVLNAIEAISMNGGATYRVTASKDEAERIAAHAMAVVPLYERQPPTLTDAEREDVRMWMTECLRQCSAATDGNDWDAAERWSGRASRASALLERLGGKR